MSVPILIILSSLLFNITGRWQVRYSDHFDFISRQVKNVMGYGGRSVSLWQTQTMSLAFDTGDELETQEFQNYPTTFNGEANNGNQSPLQQVDQRSDDHVSCKPILLR